jgi:hypothetical protein
MPTIGKRQMTHISGGEGYEPMERFPEIVDVPIMQIATAMQADVFIDPDFWQALGRARGMDYGRKLRGRSWPVRRPVTQSRSARFIN